MLADPRLVEPQPIEVLEQGQVTVQGQGRVDPDLVDGREEDPETERPGLGHGGDPSKPAPGEQPHERSFSRTEPH